MENNSPKDDPCLSMAGLSHALYACVAAMKLAAAVIDRTEPFRPVWNVISNLYELSGHISTDDSSSELPDRLQALADRLAAVKWTEVKLVKGPDDSVHLSFR